MFLWIPCDLSFQSSLIRGLAEVYILFVYGLVLVNLPLLLLQTLNHVFHAELCLKSHCEVMIFFPVNYNLAQSLQLLCFIIVGSGKISRHFLPEGVLKNYNVRNPQEYKKTSWSIKSA